MARAVVVFRDAAVEKLQLEEAASEQRVQSESDQRQNAEAQARAADEQAQVVRALANGLGKLSAGDLTYRLSDGLTNAYAQIRDDFNATIAQLQETIGAIAAATREVSNTAAEISSSTTDLSQRTEQQAASLEETSASMEQISVTVKNNAGNAREANRFAGSAREIAAACAQPVQRPGRPACPHFGHLILIGEGRGIPKKVRDWCNPASIAEKLAELCRSDLGEA